MRITTRLYLLFSVLLAVGLGAAALSVWNVRQTGFHLDRVNLTHRSFETHLSLSNHTYQLFKQYADSLLIGDRDRGVGERELLAAIDDDVQTIRDLIGREIEMVGSEEIEELEALAEIDRTIQALRAAFEEAIDAGRPETFSADWVTLSRVLERDIDRDFRVMIDSALEEEASEVRETREEVDARINALQWLAAALAVAALMAALGGVWVLRRHVERPFETLLHGVRTFSDGDMSYRTGMRGGDELAEIGRTLDAMAERISGRTAQLTGQNAALGAAVKERTEQLESLLDEARNSEANRRRMLSDVSHELRTPLTIIRGEADVALRGGDKSAEAYREALVRGREAAAHSARIVNDLLFVARSEEGEAKLALEELDLHALAREVVGDSANVVEPVAGPATVRADPGRIRQALLVLLENARHHGGEHIAVHIAPSTLGWAISVEDDGPGLDDDEKRNAFERFYRGSGAANRYAAGTGLGLPVARSIVTAHGGEVRLEDREGGGLVATIDLPGKPTLRAVR